MICMNVKRSILPLALRSSAAIDSGDWIESYLSESGCAILTKRPWTNTFVATTLHRASLRYSYSVTYCSRIGLIPTNTSNLPR